MRSFRKDTLPLQTSIFFKYVRSFLMMIFLRQKFLRRE